MTTKIPKKTERLDKTEAIKLMLDGFPTIPSSAPSKMSYKGEMICYWNFNFINISYSKSEDFDTNLMSNKFWELAKITYSMLPKSLYKANIEKAKVIELELKSIFKHEWNWSQRHKIFLPTALCEYQDIKTGKMYSVKLNLSANSMRKGSAAFELVLDTEKVEKKKAHAYWWFKNYVEEQLKIQKKRGSGKPPIKSMVIVDKIKQSIPQALI